MGAHLLPVIDSWETKAYLCSVSTESGVVEDVTTVYLGPYPTHQLQQGESPGFPAALCWSQEGLVHAVETTEPALSADHPGQDSSGDKTHPLMSRSWAAEPGLNSCVMLWARGTLAGPRSPRSGWETDLPCRQSSCGELYWGQEIERERKGVQSSLLRGRYTEGGGRGRCGRGRERANRQGAGRSVFFNFNLFIY